MWRLRPLIFLPASYPRVSAETVSAPLTDWESTIPADGTGLRRSSLTRTRAQRIVNTIKGAVLAPVAEVPVHGLPRREVLGQHPPRSARPHVIQDRVDDLTLGVLDRTTPGTRLGQQPFDQLPLPIGQIRRIAPLGRHTPQFDTRTSNPTFQNTFLGRLRPSSSNTPATIPGVNS